jgi:hypothetical protein
MTFVAVVCRDQNDIRGCGVQRSEWHLWLWCAEIRMAAVAIMRRD